MIYRNELNGLRAIALIAVVIFHLGFEVMPGGFFGVDIFFVISGYLITTIIYKDKKLAHFSVIDFYLKRMRRLLPALYVILLFSTVAAYLMLSPNDGKDYYQSLVATVLFNSNTLFYIENSNYFGLAAEYKPLLHTWSLGVEEQFYLCYPFLLLALCKLKRVENILAALVGSALIGFCLMMWCYRNDPSAAFYFLPMRCWELLVGASVALYLEKRANTSFNDRLANVGSLLGASLIGCVIFFFDPQILSMGLFLLISTIGAGLVILFATPGTLINSFLKQKWLVSIGLISYSAYLWHQPLISFFRYYLLRPLTLIDSIGVLVLTLILGAISWKGIEQPFRDRRVISHPIFFVLIVVLSLSFLLTGVAGHQTWGFKELKLSKIVAERKYIYVDHEIEAERKNVLSKEIEKKTVDISDTRIKKILILGDSVSHDLDLALKIKADNFSKYQFKNMSLDDPEMRSFLAYLQSTSLVAGQLSDYAEIKKQLDTSYEVVLAAGWTKETAKDGLALAKYLATQRPVYIADAFRIFNMAESSFYFANSSLDLELNNRYMYDRLLPEQLFIRDYFINSIQNSSGIKYIDKFSFFCHKTDRVCTFYTDKQKPLMHDELHLTVEGELFYADALAENGFFQ